MNHSPYIIIAIMILLPIFFIILLQFKKKRNIKKVNSLSIYEKNELLDSFAKPFGFLYEPSEDIFATRLDAPQKLFGYTSFYDLSAPYFNMIFDYETIYFDYNSRTWLIEIWKGQYGISTGCELGIYCADTIIPPNEHKSELFHAVDANDMLDISLQLIRFDNQGNSYNEIASQTKKHWWLTIFKPGIYTKPENLTLNIAIQFKNRAMLRSFYESFIQTLPHISCKINGLTLYFTFKESKRHYTIFRNFVRRIALASCRLFCFLYNFITRPFKSCGNKILYLYYYLPFIIKWLFKTKSPK
ncbi:MAG: DUF4474 domain-containing protein [Lachnospiraceae bacterium]|nr:DUF4474 domain-containing protein [Lachnospiraceae bacterium]